MLVKNFGYETLNAKQKTRRNRGQGYNEDIDS